MKVYQIGSSRHPANDGEGARRYGGRWNHKGTAVIYAGESVALCALEVLVNQSTLPTDCIVVEIRIPDALKTRTLRESELPSGWDDPSPRKGTRDIGTKWALEQATAILLVPSSIIPSERNYLLNPNHPDFVKIKFGAPKPFRFDQRLQ